MIKTMTGPYLGSILALTTAVVALAAEPLPGTKPLDAPDDLARGMVDGIHRYLDRELAAAPEHRESLKPDRERLKTILGVVDQRVTPRLEVYAPLARQSKTAVIDGCEIHRVRWDVLPGVQAEGLFLRGAGEKCTARVVAVPDAGQTPEQLAGLKEGDDFALRLARSGCEVLIPTVINRSSTFSGNPQLPRQTNQPHREFLYRMAYEMGRTPIGYEVQKVLAAVDYWYRDGKPSEPIGVIGFGEGGRIALYSAALDDRIAVCQVAGAFGPQENIATQPIDRNIWSLLTEFGDAEVASLIAPRLVIIDKTPGPKWSGPTIPKTGRNTAASGILTPFTNEEIESEFARLVVRAAESASLVSTLDGTLLNTDAFLKAIGVTKSVQRGETRNVADLVQDPSNTPERIQQRQFTQLVTYTQKLWRDSDAVRKVFWKKADAGSPATWEKSCEEYRKYYGHEIIGLLPKPTLPMNPQSRVIYDEPNWTGYEITLDLYPDVYATGILLLPKGMKPGEKRPVVVCQHGLEGRPQNVCNPKEDTRAYHSFGARLADRGFIVYAPQNPYIFKNEFRQIVRKANPLKLSLYSFIVAQNERTFDWLETLPHVDPKRIGYYGLSYGGKTAMRVPALDTRYACSICSGDFNEWIGKNVSIDLDRSYMWTHEYEIFEFNLGNTFNYAELAYLIAPRPFMVERGHDDGVGIDEMVAYEYAKVRYLYANRLRIPNRTRIEFSVGVHEIFLKGTLQFLESVLGKPTK